MSNFKAALLIVLDHEGKEYTDDPDDNGGPTKWGIALNDDFGALSKILGRPATAEDIKNMTPEIAAQIYEPNYWDPMSLDHVVSDYNSLVLFDQGVLEGIREVTVLAQQVCGIPDDGIFGPQTLAHVNAMGSADFCKAFLQSCANHYKGIVNANPKDAKYLAGWENRVLDLAKITGVTVVV